MPKVLILYAKVGGGHESAAKSIKKQILDISPTTKVEIYDIFENSNSSFVGTVMEKGYILLVEKLVFIWKILLFLFKIPFIATIGKWVLNRLVRSNVREKIWQCEPDVIISTYYYVIDVAAKNIPKKISNVELFTIVTDTFSPHPIWFSVKNGSYVLFSQKAKDIALTAKIDDKRLTLFGSFFNNSFNETITSKSAINLKILSIGFNPNNQILLLAGGGSSLPNGEKLLKNFVSINSQQKDKKQLIIVCGRNQKLKLKLEKILKNHPDQKKLVKIFGFTNKMYDFINIADLIIAKAGPAFVFESLSQFKPIIINSFIPDQEWGNVEYILDNKFGYFQPNPEKCIEKCFNLLGDRIELGNIRNRLIKAQIKSDILNLAKFLVKISQKNLNYNQLKMLKDTGKTR